MTVRSPFLARLSLLGVVVALLVGTACAPQATSAAGESEPRAAAAESEEPRTSEAAIRSSIPEGATGVDLERRLTVRVDAGTFEDVEVTAPEGGVVKGKLSKDGARWVSRGRFEPDTRYRLSSTAVDSRGLEQQLRSEFRTRKLTLDEQTYPSFVPVEGQTVGVGMPVIIRFDVPVADRASIERHLKVESTPTQVGAFHWMSSQEVHWRPRSYWQPGTDVTVTADIGGVPAGNGIYGQLDRTLNFHVGDAMVSKVDMKSLQMKVFRNGDLVRTMPVTTGEQPKFTTRSGTKVIVEKFRRKRMNSETIGIDPESADGYDLDDVEYAMRLTYSGEFVHAAPWSVPQQGRANVSHGCTGMSTENAGWLYENTRVGDVIEYVGSSRGMSLSNGFGDWNASFRDYKAGSALS